jgi:NADH:ubiquinone oxidoreductase subunit 5 (subunit L)/multisubunit Na+/H+ antiporter MnhA subunit
MGLKVDSLALTMSFLILLISGIVHVFSLRYMDGDRKLEQVFCTSVAYHRQLPFVL